MRRFTQLVRDLDERNRQTDKRVLLVDYFCSVPAEDAAWALWFLWGGRLGAGISSRRLRQWATEITEYPAWLVQHCQAVVGDLGETSALLLPRNDEYRDISLSSLVEEHIQPLMLWDEGFQFYLYRRLCPLLEPGQTSLIHKLLTGPLRIGLPKRLLVKALSDWMNIPAPHLAVQLASDWRPGAEFFASLQQESQSRVESSAVKDPALARLLQDLEDDEGEEHPRHRARLVLIYAQAGRGGGSASFSELTLAARDGDSLVSVTRTGAGLEEADVKTLDQWIRENTIARKGPVRTVPAEMVFEVGFTRARASRRRKSGLELRFPRITAWLREGDSHCVDTVEDLRRFLEA